MADNKTISIRLPEEVDLVSVLGRNDENIRIIQDRFLSKLSVHGRDINITGPASEVESISKLIADIIEDVRIDGACDPEAISKTIDSLLGEEMVPAEFKKDVILTYKGRAIRPKTPGQKEYVDAIRSNSITFGIGPAGTGKTYLAMALALSALERKEVGRIILSRPIVEAGENLGFLPGTLTEKVDPYIRPLYDALFSMFDAEHAQVLFETGVIEIAPLAFMRGRTLNDSFIILDEAQNTTPEQMKMALTRLGQSSKMVITGDTSQIDIPKGNSGLLQVQQILSGIDDIAFCKFSGKDVIRNSLVRKIIDAYERFDDVGGRKSDGASAVKRSNKEL